MKPQRLREAHAHIAQLGRSMAMVDLSESRSKADMLERLRTGARSLDHGQWLLARSLRVESFDEPEWPTARDLDQVVGRRPALAMSFDYHSLVASTEALRLARIEELDDPHLVERDRDGRPTGVLFEDGARQVWRAVPEPTPQQLRTHVRDALTQLKAMGFVEIHELLAHPPIVRALLALDHDATLDDLDVDVHCYVPLEQIHDALDARESAGRVRIAGTKIFVDGTLNSRTAWMLEPFADPHPAHPTGLSLIDPARLRDVVRRSDDLGLPVAAHAIGDGAVRAVLDAIESVNPRTRGFRIEHAEVIDVADVPRFARLGVTCSPQPCHLLADIEALRRYLPHRLDHVLPLRDLIDAGCTPGELLVFGSDVPIVRADPEDSILAATARRRPDMQASQAIAPAQAITEEEAWACFAPAR